MVVEKDRSKVENERCDDEEVVEMVGGVGRGERLG